METTKTELLLDKNIEQKRRQELLLAERELNHANQQVRVESAEIKQPELNKEKKQANNSQTLDLVQQSSFEIKEFPSLASLPENEITRIKNAIYQHRAHIVTASSDLNAEMLRFAQQLTKNNRSFLQLILNSDQEARFIADLNNTLSALNYPGLNNLLLTALRSTKEYLRAEARYKPDLKLDPLNFQLSIEDLRRAIRLPERALRHSLLKEAISEISNLSNSQLVLMAIKLMPYLETLTRIRSDEFASKQQIDLLKELLEKRSSLINKITKSKDAQDQAAVVNQELSVLCDTFHKYLTGLTPERQLSLAKELMSADRYKLFAEQLKIDPEASLNVLALIMSDRLLKDNFFALDLARSTGFFNSYKLELTAKANLIVEFVRQCRVLVIAAWINIREIFLQSQAVPVELKGNSDRKERVETQQLHSLFDGISQYLEQGMLKDEQRKEQLQKMLALLPAKVKNIFSDSQEEEHERAERKRIYKALLSKYPQAANSPQLSAIAQLDYINQAISDLTLLELYKSLQG